MNTEFWINWTKQKVYQDNLLLVGRISSGELAYSVVTMFTVLYT